MNQSMPAERPDAAASPQVLPLEISGREILKGTLVPLRSAAHRRSTGGLAIVKYGAVRQMKVAAGEVAAVREHLVRASGLVRAVKPSTSTVSESTFTLLEWFERAPVPALQPDIPAMARIPVTELAAFAQGLVEVRAARLAPAAEAGATHATEGQRTAALNAAVMAAKGLALNAAIEPIGMLNLERIEMVPAGIERGELIATIPLAPGEETAVTHKEWSVTSKEFTSIVTDSMESVSENGVTDNTDLSQSTTSQNQHSNQFNITGTVQGGIPMINGSSTAGATVQDASSASETSSIKHATSITQKASARSRQEHKITVSATTVTGTSETSTRTLKNTSATDPVRIDYFSLMRKWRVRLYRFGLRMTYDLVIPEPGAAMRRDYATLEWLRSRQGPFVFDVKNSYITNEHVDSRTGLPVPPSQPGIPRYRFLADSRGVSVPAFPAAPAVAMPFVRGDGNNDWNYLDLEFDVPPGAQIDHVLLTTVIGGNSGMSPRLKVLGARVVEAWATGEAGSDISVVDWPVMAVDGVADFLSGATGHQKVSFWMWHTSAVYLGFKVFYRHTAAAEEQWRTDVWNALFNAAQTRYYSDQQQIESQIAALEDQLANVDTLTLRREESDEIMKGVLKFVMGHDFDLMPDDVTKVFMDAKVDLAHGVGFDGDTSGLDLAQWSILKRHEEIVRFINQAIEWENVVTFLYSYFWDVPESWAFIRKIRHPDSSRQAFLRAGSARVVLTVRKGWEDQWLHFVNTGTPPDQPADAVTTGPYLTIAQEIAAYDDRHYPGIPAANPAKSAVRLPDSTFTTSRDKLTPSAEPVAITVESSADFVVGLAVVIDVEDTSHIQESAVVVAVDAPPGSITVARLAQPHDGTNDAFPVIQPGAKGTLIAEWNEYTPSSGTDIAVTSNLTTIA